MQKSNIMAYLCVDKNGDEVITDQKPERVFHNNTFVWWIDEQTTEGEYYSTNIELPKGTIEKILGYPLTWEDEPVKIL